MNKSPMVDDCEKGSTQLLTVGPALLLWTLTAAFSVRVLAQAVQRWWPQSFLPPFQDFQGSDLSYPILFSVQLIIVAMMLRTASLAAQATLESRARLGEAWWWFGCLYWSGSMLRIGVGLADAGAPSWFHAWISEFFHLVLAGFVITLAVSRRANPVRLSLAPVWYPTLVLTAFAGFATLLEAGSPPILAAYLPVFLVGIAVLSLEQQFAERSDWQPTWGDARTDMAFLLLVQGALPRLLTATALALLAERTRDYLPRSPWPHDWPLAIQILLMILIVDFLRYWLHRACHQFPVLWRLHEVHHSPRLLYTLNVGRFHPLEKALHFCLDTVPFLVAGVTAPVIAGYFLLYSVNGFFQHSNLRLRYGPLNYFVGSAETHRWHHARDRATPACNFSNTTIVWDLIFGTWYLPAGKAVGAVGIPDDRYPTGFIAQVGAPFRKV